MNQSPPGSRFVLVLRHAKAASGSPGGDHERPLVERGRRDARALGHRLAAGGRSLGFSAESGDPIHLPTKVLCSSAVRTKETADLVIAGLSPEHQPELEVVRAFYSASPEILLDRVRELDTDVSSVLVVGHNPTMYEFTWELVGPSSLDRATLERHGFPTCTLAVVELQEEGAWEAAGRAPASLRGVVSPPY